MSPNTDMRTLDDDAKAKVVAWARHRRATLREELEKTPSGPEADVIRGKAQLCTELVGHLETRVAAAELTEANAKRQLRDGY